MELFLPELLYCDRTKLIQYLSVLVDKFLPSYRVEESQTRDGERSLGGDLVRIAAKIGKSYSEARTVEGMVVETDASLFVDLRDLLYARNLIRVECSARSEEACLRGTSGLG